MPREKILSKRNLRRATDNGRAHKLKASYVDAARLHFQAMWKTVLDKMDPIDRSRALLMVEECAQDFADQAERGLAVGRAGGKPEPYRMPERFAEMLRKAAQA